MTGRSSRSQSATTGQVSHSSSGPSGAPASAATPLLDSQAFHATKSEPSVKQIDEPSPPRVSLFSDSAHSAQFASIGTARVKLYRTTDFVERHASLRRGDSFAKLLQRYDVPAREALIWQQAALETFDLSRLRPRRSLTLFFDRGTDELAAVEYLIDRANVLFLERDAQGEIHAERLRVPFSVELRAVSGRIDESMNIDCSEAGVPERIVSELTDIFAWDIDFDELRSGDAFRAVYELAIGEDGSVIQTGNILGAEIEASGTVYTAIYHADQDGRGGYFDADGRSLDRGQLRFPLEFTRISSEFSARRFHPILRRDRPHMGVDFAAPAGTPVRAVADGVISTSGWKGQLGKTVRVEHQGSSSQASLYGHLRRIASRLTPGTRVSKGELIGYVGQTGCATGPHLHFALFSGEDYVNPLEIPAPPRVAAAGAVEPRFERTKVAVLGMLASLRKDGPVRLTRLVAAARHSLE